MLLRERLAQSILFYKYTAVLCGPCLFNVLVSQLDSCMYHDRVYSPSRDTDICMYHDRVYSPSRDTDICIYHDRVYSPSRDTYICMYHDIVYSPSRDMEQVNGIVHVLKTLSVVSFAHPIAQVFRSLKLR
mgnify:FL=1